MQRRETSTGHDQQQPRQEEATSAEWGIAAYGNALDAESMGTTDIVYGCGVRYGLGKHETGQQTTLEIFARHGVVRLTHLTEGVQVTLLHQETPPTVTPDGLVFDLPTPSRWLAVGKDGSATLFMGAPADARPSPASRDRIPATDNRPVIHADAPPPPAPERKEPPARGRIEGNLVYDPVYKVTSRQQREITTFVVAEHYTDAGGEQQTIFHRCVAFNTERKRLADEVREHARQGDAVIAHGAWHEVPITYRNGIQKTERQLWLYGIKITPKDVTG